MCISALVLSSIHDITDDSGQTVSFREGETILIPATTKTIKVEGTIKFLETYV